MKKKWIILMMLAVMVIGCQEEVGQEIRQTVRPLSSIILPKTLEQKTEYEKWKAVYGDNEITQMHYNIAILLQIADQHGGVINTNRKFIGTILSPADPNSLASVVVRNRRLIQGLVDENKRLAEQMNDKVDKLVFTGTTPKTPKTLKTLEDHNIEAVSNLQETFEPQLNGIACPKCGAELYDLTPVATLTSHPPQFETICSNVECDYRGTRF